jgi:hypothetical protein
VGAIARSAEHRLVALGEKLVPDRFGHLGTPGFRD